MAPYPPSFAPRFSRRTLFGLAAGAVALAAFPDAVRRSLAWAITSAGGPWSRPGTWGGRAPGPGDVAVISKTVVLDRDARVAGVVVQPGGKLVFGPSKSRTLTSTGNVVVEGRLAMRPSKPQVEHRIVFEGIDEGQFQGGGMDPLDTDVGLWVMGNGVLDIVGSKRLPWARVTGSVPKGATSITLDADPTGWRPGDEIIIAPTDSPANGTPSDSYDATTIAVVDGRTITLAGATQYAHPPVTVGGGNTLSAEVLNLTRNVVIEGTAGGRSHVFVRSTKPQTVRRALIRRMGPRRSTEFGDFVLGRYGLHFHECGDGSRGSIIQAVVVRNAGSHAFVAHNSHGVTFRRCISHDTLEIPYWWDDEGTSRSHDILYERCVASFARSESAAFRLSGFFMGGGEGNVARDCVAVGIGGQKQASGYFWPGARSEGIWTFEDNLAHNCDVDGIFTWQNTGSLHVITGFVAYHNGGAGIEHGAYRNPYRYEGSILHGNARAAVQVHAASRFSNAGAPLRFSDLTCDGAGLSDYLLITARKIQEPDGPTEVTRCSFRDYRKAAIGFVDDDSPHPDVFDIVDCAFDANAFWLDSDIHRDSLIRVQDAINGSISLQRADRPGDFNPDWNASVHGIAPFAGG